MSIMADETEAEPAAPTAAEAPALVALKDELRAELAAQPPWPDLIGDIRLLRFVRGHDCDVAAAADAYRQMLAWRAEAGMDAVRADIEARNLQLQWSDMPDGERVSRLVPMVINAGWSSRRRLPFCCTPLFLEQVFQQ